MVRFIHFFKMVFIQVRVDLSRRNIAVPQKRLNKTKICAAFQQMRCKGMTQCVWRNGFGNSGSTHPFS